MSEIDLQANKETDNVYQDDHTQMSSPRPDIGPDVSLVHSLVNPHIIDDVDMKE